MSTQKASIEEFFNRLSADTMDCLDEFYHPRIVFEDPVGRHQGLASLRAYYAHLYREVQSIRFDFPLMVEEGDTVIARWRMFLSAKGIKRGQMIEVDGYSEVRFQDGLVIYHRDSFDMGAFLYEHLPLLGWVLRWLKKSLHRSG